jgi:hypothetical protein
MLKSLKIFRCLLVLGVLLYSSYASAEGVIQACDMVSIETKMSEIAAQKTPKTEAELADVKRIEALLADPDALLASAEAKALEIIEASRMTNKRVSKETELACAKHIRKFWARTVEPKRKAMMKRYGVAYGGLTFATMIVGELSVPIIPGSGLVTAAPLVVVAELFLYVRGKLKRVRPELIPALNELQLSGEIPDRDAGLNLVDETKKTTKVELASAWTVYQAVQLNYLAMLRAVGQALEPSP